ncbi:MAG: homocysteine S-methyltransferase family protein [Rhodobacteraceae bacterium]|nr:homocysteine S-methyltransferase family protein [Paracoccaceae bacterium]
MTEIVLLDGSIGQEIVRRAGDRPTPLWATRAMLDHPGLLKQVHADYFRAGATIATTNTYAIHRDRFVETGLEGDFERLIAQALAEATAARDGFGGGRIAGSIGPLGASYRADVVPVPEIAAPLIAEVAGLLAPQVDLLICETVCSLNQAEGALRGVVETGLPVWLAVTVSDSDGSRLRSGEAVADLGDIVARYQPAAVLANCSVPEAMAAALGPIGDFGLPFGAYANGFRAITSAFLQDRPTVDALEARSDLGPEDYADFAQSWVEMGASIVGGCCETGPVHIAAVKNRLERAGHVIV